MFGDLLRQRRIESGGKISQLAAAAGLSRQHLSEVEAGKRQVGIKTFLRLADLVTVPSTAWVGAFLDNETRLLPLLHVAGYLIDRGDYVSAQLVLERIRSMPNTSRRYQGHVYHQMGRYLFETGHQRPALRWLRSAYRAAARSSDPHARAVAAYNLGLSLMSARYLARSLAAFDQANIMFRESGRLDKTGYARLHKANLLTELGSFREALSEYRRAAFALRNEAWSFDCKLGEAICLWQLNSPAAGLRKLLTLTNRNLDSNRCAKLHHNLGVLYRHLGDLERSRHHLQEALQYDGRSPASCAATLAELCLNQVLSGLDAEALHTKDRFDALLGPKEPQDVLTLAILSKVLGTPSPDGIPTVGCHDDYEQRLTAALSLLLSARRT